VSLQVASVPLRGIQTCDSQTTYYDKHNPISQMLTSVAAAQTSVTPHGFPLSAD